MKALTVYHYLDKKLQITQMLCECLKLEIRAKMIVLTHEEEIVFACKLTDFISLQVEGEQK